ncbi:acetylcholine receptor subunit alpha-like isoform X1 [Vespula pensylvanica]|uniref:acetylcholine receptor subunit alpha-like isoform X1 n=2 Tax=Vespula pensylvanica TaxID=30213 RepID=UPI001CB9FAFE|nr:acetylcholine receptor subunit alpha-like isoform X1 [Vespula pensylvanica]XP_043666634.1 acetylcholine receptor subunit alpha-like isoform X1 [Vespula pensylvanica]XP_043666635.1 acetylcholine receptor subunit alpha-like isoform X1 [Vespula pensylvanica]XP_043666636.1 acetylcholine receptor subunit alpha-like isoform X1 [Vespula pensylvanica]XP_050848523.1 acetylcholine receptor subunit alpha-like isoform X1 [Vespula vulgaris]XP_050848524.1 acetylcholine receptor subunit alpha-like isoform
MMKSLVGIMWIVLVLISGCSGNPDAKRLYDDLLSNYNKLVRPVVNVTDALTVKIKLKLSQLIDVNLKNQIMTTNLWVEQSWYDYKLKWDPKEYGGVEMLHVPSDHIWRPDIVLYNNADGNFEVTLATKATLNYTGRVEWKPPAIYKSSCEIDVEYFPFDEQTCVMKFGSWTYDGFQVDLRHIDEIHGSNVVNLGVDLSEFYTSVEWDILEVPAVRNEKFYTCCNEPYLDITFNITMRRKTLFYTVNLIIPCMGISFLTVLVFYLPSDSGEKVSLSISILLSLTVFFLLLAEIIPPTSLVVPLLGKFVLFTMILDTFSICITVVVLNVHFRSPQTHVMAPWVRRVFIHVLPRLLAMRRYNTTSKRTDYDSRPQYEIDKRSIGGQHGQRVMVRTCNGLELRDPSLFVETSASELVESSVLFPSLDSQDELHPRELEAVNLGSACRIHGSPAATVAPPPQLPTEESVDALCNTLHHWHHCPELYKAIEGIRFIAEHTKREEDSTRVKEDWKYVAMVLDRLFLWIFTLAVVVGTAGIILQAPTLYDDRVPIDVRLSEIASTTAKPHIVTSL